MVYPGARPLKEDVLPPPNPSIKALIINYCSKGYPSTFFAQQLPTIVIGAQGDLFRGCEQNTMFMDNVVEAKGLRSAVDFVKRISGTENILVFDGAVGGFNVSEPLAEEMLKLAPEVTREVDQVLMPMWLEQRGIK